MKAICTVLLILMLLSCNKENDPTSISSAGSITNNTNTTVSGVLTGKWKLVEYHNLTLGTTVTEPKDIARSVVIDFSDNGSVGKMSGLTITNGVGGDYTLLKDNKMKTLSFAGSKVWEPSWGSDFWNAILTASSYERNDKVMFIYYNKDGERMKFEEQ